MTEFETELRRNVRGEIAFDEVTRGIYATDASHYQVMPSCVVTPQDEHDALAAIRIAGKHKIPITARGGGTSLSGQATWTGMVLDMSRHMNRVLETNIEQRWVRVQPGVVRDTLNSTLAGHRLHFAPDPATGSRATVGGMIGNNSSGTRSIVYGKTLENVLECKIALWDGSILHFESTSRTAWMQIESGCEPAATIYRNIRDIVETNVDEIQRRFPKVMRRVGGYNLDAFVDPKDGSMTTDWNPTAIIVGSEGTLGVLLEAKLKLEPLPVSQAICVVHFRDLFEALGSIPRLLEYTPSAIELLDHIVVRESRRNVTTKALAGVFEGEPDAVLVIELFGDDAADVQQRISEMASQLAAQQIGYAWPIRADVAGQRDVWELRKLGLGLIANAPGKRKGQAFIEDACVPVEVLADYIRQVYDICQRHDVDVTAYAHASVGVLHVRPMLDLHDPSDVRLMRDIAHEVFALVKKYGGSWSGEHGDGLLRGEFVQPFFGDQLYQAFRQLKRAFDPHLIMNPGKIVDAAAMTENLRFGANYHPVNFDTVYQYRDHGSFQLAVEQCNGVGACRKVGAGVMCPSYMATRDEQHTTRGRANALRMAMTGQLPNESLTGDRIAEVLDLCLSCKACKSECPTSVDMARFKSEVLQMRYDRHGTPRAARLVADLPKWLQRLPFSMNRMIDRIQRTLGLERIAKTMLGFDQRRSLPRLADHTFFDWYRSHNVPNDRHPRRPSKGNVVLFVDTFTNYMEPQIGIAAVGLLRGCGFDVTAANAGCCQRTAISKGLLRDAKQAGTRTLLELDQGLANPIVVIEPSCASSLVDDLPDLCDDAALGLRVANRVRLLDDFLAQQIVSDNLQDVTFTTTQSKLMIHTHCHQKAIFSATALPTILNRVNGLDWQMVAAGCCGMAGSFGYEHYDLSQQIGEDRLFPAIRNRDAGRAVAAVGTSCRQQIKDVLNVDAQHWVDTFAFPCGNLPACLSKCRTIVPNYCPQLFIGRVNTEAAQK